MALARNFALMGATFALAACASVGDVVGDVVGGEDEPETYEVRLAAGADANPNAAGRPSPTLVKVLTLNADATFRDADFFDLFEETEQTLGADLANQAVTTLTPGEEITIDIEGMEETGFIAVIAGFRALDDAEWRAVAPLSTFRKERVRIDLAGSRVTLDGE